MKKPSSKIRDEIAKLQDQLRAAETREAERIGRIALKAGLGELEIDETVMLSRFEDIAADFRPSRGTARAVSDGRGKGAGQREDASSAIPPGPASSGIGEA
ncbi:TraC family protein [Rhizobiales bacterium RZME27]|uniref:TraC family protein n=1 Tax=Endobacterium cereale TaxID=2663029 RepID=A0A6A8A9Z6_9HYPH|nr:conjugal transfer protein TraC [Endobacterium cereale]MEB2846624.1 conjugal transfer protein TraC [Endobacterium cereale]MQY46450.1 TraC family protein [Endobacterium cereale]